MNTTPRFLRLLQKIPRGVRWMGGVAFAGFVLFLLLNVIFPFEVDLRYSTVVTANDGTVLHAFLSPDDKWRMKLEPAELTPELRNAFLYKEDRWFEYHPGINVFAMGRAAFNNSVKSRRTSGASTITMQVARLLDPKPRTYGNKLQEVFRALQLEWQFSKDEILGMYLNLVPYGGNIEGVKAASILYFEKLPDHLSPAEIATLAIVPNRPSSLRLGHNNATIVEARNEWLKRFQAGQLFPEQAILDALDEPLTAARQNAPQDAPHFSLRMKRKFPHLPTIATQLDPGKQANIEKLTRQHVNKLRSLNINNAAVLVLNNHTGAVEAYVGSADFNNGEDAGQVDGIRAIRSPGSTLKPLLYGLAFEKGIATPKTTVSDVETSFAGYTPENYDGLFHGNVTVEYALANSLNVPAVRVLDQLQPRTLVDRLRKAGFRQIDKDKEKLGHSVVLGGCGVTLEELTRLYASFANGGRLAPINWLQSDSTLPGDTILTAPATFLLTNIMTTLTRPDLPMDWQHSPNLPRVAWKTGTSYGRKDAWSIGFNREYTVGVWVGNFSAEGVPELNGAEMASPLLFQVFNTIQQDESRNWVVTPDGIDSRWVCSHSGQLPSAQCTDQVMDDFIPMVSSTATCKHLKKVWVNPDSTLAYCTSCLPDVGYITAWYPNHKPEIVSWLESGHVPYAKVPPHNPDCERLFSEGAPQITSPVPEVEYFVNPDDSSALMLSCNPRNDVEKVFWYVNNHFLREATPHEHLFFMPPEGRVKLSCTDDKGRNSNAWITVKYARF